MANLIYRVSSTAPSRGSSTIKGLPLTNLEIDGNFKLVDDALLVLAPLASPALTGVPTAPTATAGTNTTQLATTAHVFAERANTATLTNKTISLTSNTLTFTSAQLLASCSDETGTGSLVFGTAPTISAPNITGHPTIEGVTPTGATGTGVLVFGTSPTLSGVPAAPTAAPGTNTTQLATTAFVTAAVAGTVINNGTLTLSVSGTGLSGSQTFTANQAGNATFTVTSNATSLNTASTVVARDASGNFTAGVITATDFNTTSDLRLKENFSQINGLSMINMINPTEFTWKDTGKKSYGVVAQQLEQIFPELVIEREDGFKGVSYIPIIAMLVDAVNELSSRLVQLEA